MQRLLPETKLEMKLMSFGASFIEENSVLDELAQVLDVDLNSDNILTDDERENALAEIGEYFFRLDMNYGPEIKEDCIAILNDFWNVKDREGCVLTLEGIRHQGHRTKFNVLKSSVPPEGPIDVNSLEKFKAIFNFDLEEGHDLEMPDSDYRKLAEWIQKTNRFLKEAGILGWDLGRYVQLVRLSFMAGYLSDIQAWSEILKLAPLAEGRFNTWMDFSQSFLIGRTFWAGTDDPRVKAICEKLLGHPASPWLFVDAN